MDNLPPLREIVKNYGLIAEKKMGQNFLFDMNITDKIVRASGDISDDIVVEVGPGPGGLTRSILNAGAKHVFAIEKDPRCINALQDYLLPQYQDRLTLIAGDALDLSVYQNIFSGQKMRIIANLPYNIATELLFIWLDNLEYFSGFTLMFQREVAMRINAKCRTKDYGRLSVKSQLLCEVEHIFDIPPSAFFPPPKITSSVIKLTSRDKLLYDVDQNILEKLCRITFGQRRKTLRVSLKQIMSDSVTLLAKSKIDDARRPEELTIEEFCRLANEVRDAGIC